MATSAQLRKFALSLPEAEESSHFGQPDFRVRGKIFCELSPDGILATLKLGPELQSMMVDAKPEVFLPASGYWGRLGWTRVRLKEIEFGALKGLIEEAWRLVAPKRLVKQRG